MKKYLTLIVLLLVFIGCSGNKEKEMQGTWVSKSWELGKNDFNYKKIKINKNGEGYITVLESFPFSTGDLSKQEMIGKYENGILKMQYGMFQLTGMIDEKTKELIFDDGSKNNRYYKPNSQQEKEIEEYVIKLQNKYNEEIEKRKRIRF